MKISSKHMLCLILLTLALTWAEDSSKSGRRAHNDAVRVQAKPRRLFARQKVSASKGLRPPKHKTDPMAPARRCGRLTDTCSPRLPCCDPCASCRCRLFNTICHCWRTNQMCSKWI